MKTGTPNELVARIDAFIETLKAEADNPEAFPRPARLDLDMLRALTMAERGTSPRGNTPSELTCFCACTLGQANASLNRLAGLLAIHGAPMRLRREILPSGGRLYLYRLVRA